MADDPSALSIRSARADDIPAVSALLIAAWHATYDSIYGSVEVDEVTGRWHTVAVLSAQLDTPNTVFLVAEDHEGLLGTSYARRMEDGVVMLDRIYLRPDVLGRGIGTQLIDATMATFQMASRVRLEVAPKNAPAIAFYQRHGFAKVGSVSNCGSTSNMAADIYEKVL